MESEKVILFNFQNLKKIKEKRKNETTRTGEENR